MKPDDGLIAPAGYEIVRWPDGSPKMVDIRFCDVSQAWISHQSGCPTPNACTGPVRIVTLQHGEYYLSLYRIALKKLPERKLLNFREAVAAHGEGKNIRCEGEQHFWWHNSRSYPQSGGVSAVPIQWMLDRTDFYIQENPS